MSWHRDLLPLLGALLSGALCLVLGVPFAGLPLHFGAAQGEVL